MSYRDEQDDDELTSEEKARIHANNYAEHTRFTEWTDKQRLNAASNFGPNWASVLSGMGDQ